MSASSNPVCPALRQLARCYGVQTSYIDASGRRQIAPAEALLAVLRALGAPARRMSDVPEALREARRRIALRALEPVQVSWLGGRTGVALRLPDGALRGALRCEWRLETGEVRRTEIRLDHLPPERAPRADGCGRVVRRVPLPPGLPVGCHHVGIEWGQGRFETHLFRAPPRCFQAPSAQGSWGLFVPLYALHSKRSWGAGDLSDLSELVAWVGSQGGRFAGTLPLLPAFLDQPCEPSPYSPVSRLFWNEFYLDLERVPELQSCAAARRLLRSSAFQERRRHLQRAHLVDYRAQMALKRQALEALSRSFFSQPSARRCEFDRFQRSHPDAADYARFRAVHEERGEPWTRWPARMRGGNLREADCRPSLQQYHQYVQWLAHEQMEQLSDRARQSGVDLYLDMPLGVHRDGYDVWRHPRLFAQEASGGAPPDPMFTQGQDWGFAPIHPQRSRDQGHAYIRAYLRHHLRHARMLRIDHVMGLHRLYWVPRGFAPGQGVYVTYPSEDFYAMLSIESHRHQAVIVGENLGTVPPEVNRGLRRHGIAGMFVAQCEARPWPHRALRPIPADVVASLNTHDMPMFAAFWEALDIADRCDLGLIQRADLARDYRWRDRVRRAIIHQLVADGRIQRGQADAGTAMGALVEHLGASAARWILLNLEDLWLETAPQNTPGTTIERVNWRRKTQLGLEQLSRWRKGLAMLENMRRARTRSHGDALI